MLSRSLWLAVGLTVLLVGWLLSGYPYEGPAEVAAPPAREAEPMAVQVEALYAQPAERRLLVPGQVEPNRTVTLRAQTGGQVTDILVERGSRVAEGEALLRLAMEDRQARLAQAQALLTQRQQDYEALSAMSQRGFQSESQLRQALAELEAARAALRSIELEIEHTEVVAPFDGIVYDRSVELGTMVDRGDTLLTLVDNDPLVVSAQVPQHRIHELAVGEPGTVRLTGGETIDGTIRYIAPQADEATRTFRVELEVANPDSERVSGVSGELQIPLETVSSHFLSPAQLALDESGVLGVKIVDEDDRVVFLPVQIVRSGPEGVWVAGLPEQVRVITVGQGFVQPGEQVRPVSQSQSAIAAMNDRSQLAGSQ